MPVGFVTPALVLTPMLSRKRETGGSEPFKFRSTMSKSSRDHA